jgi:hypothetical protein
MHNHAEEFKITSMSRVLVVSRSGFYRWRQRGEQPTRRQQQRLALDKLVADAFVALKMRACSPSLVLDLHYQGHAYNRKTVTVSMKRQNLRAKAARKYGFSSFCVDLIYIGIKSTQNDKNKSKIESWNN